MHAVALRIDLRIPHAHSLKEKRSVIRRLEGGLRRRFEVSVAEVDHQNQHQRSAIGVALVSGEAFQVRKVAESVHRWVEGYPDVEVLDVEICHLVPE